MFSSRSLADLRTQAESGVWRNGQQLLVAGRQGRTTRLMAWASSDLVDVITVELSDQFEESGRLAGFAGEGE